MNIIKYLTRESWKQFLVVSFLGLASGLCGAGLASIISRSITGGTTSRTLPLYFFALCLLYLVFKTHCESALIRLTQKAVLQMRIDLSRRLLATPYERLLELGPHQLFMMLTNDTISFVTAFQVLPTFLTNVVVIVGSFAYMVWLAWKLSVVVAIALLLSMWGYHFAERRPLQKLAAMRESMNVLFGHFRDLVAGTRELQLNALRGRTFVDEVIAPQGMEFQRIFISAMSKYALIVNIGAVLFYVIVGVMVFVLPTMLTVRSSIVTAFALILLFMIRPITEVMSALPTMRQAEVSYNKICQLEGNLSDVADRRTAENPFDTREPLIVEMRDIRYHYGGSTSTSHFEVGPINLTIGQGEIVFVVGGNGSGKTTLAMLLLGFLRPTAGVVALNGIPVNDSNLFYYREYFSAIFSDFHLFEQLLLPGRSDVAIDAASYIQRLGMAKNVKMKNGRFSTINLSTGQRKRLALVSSYLEDRPIHIYDEWAADQDPAFRAIFYTQLLPELKMRGKTVIVITHDDRYFSHADRIIKLTDGKFTA